jgi:hypothetical protein
MRPSYELDELNEAEFALRTARFLLPQQPDQAQRLIDALLRTTLDPRLRRAVAPIIKSIKDSQYEAAARWIDRAIAYDARRRGEAPLGPVSR